MNHFIKNSLVIQEENTKQNSTMMVTLYLQIKLTDVRKILCKILMNIGFYIKLSSQLAIE